MKTKIKHDDVYRLALICIPLVLILYAINPNIKVFGSHVVVFIKLLNPEQFKLISSLNVIILPPPLALSGRALHPLVSVWVAESLGDSTLGQSRSKEVLRSRR